MSPTPVPDALPDEHIVRVEGVSLSYGRGGLMSTREPVRILHDVDLAARRGEIFGIVGESGCGKSTLARLLLGVEAPDSGRILIDGKPLSSFDRRQKARMIQPIFQDPFSSLNPRMTVRQIVAAPLKVQGNLGKAERTEYVEELLQSVGLSRHLFNSYPGQLSGGQCQRIAIARALAIHPRILLCDEPTSALDVSIQAQVINLIIQMKAKYDFTVLFISHDIAVISYIADSLMVMRAGRVEEHGATRAVLNHPKQAYTKTLLSSVLVAEAGRRLGEQGD